MFRLSQDRKRTYRLNAGPQMWSSILSLVVMLTLNFEFSSSNTWFPLFWENSVISEQQERNIWVARLASIMAIKIDLGIFYVRNELLGWLYVPACHRLL